MNTEIGKNMNQNNRTKPSSQAGDQKNKNATKIPQEAQTERTGQGSGMNQAKSDRDPRNVDGSRTIDRNVDDEGDSEKEVTEPKEFKKADQRFNDQSDRA